MKKLFIIAAAALVALAACTKTEKVSTNDDALIGFNVVKYTGQTRAYNSLLDEQADGAQIASFTTNAWFHDGADAYGSQAFMADQEITPENTTDPSFWSPTGRNYYWPKTGYINFFSYAGSHTASAVVENGISFTDAAIDTLSNILVADAAYRYSRNTTNDSSIYQQNSVEKGVPTLFRHILAKVKFDVIFDAKTDMVNPDSKDKWTVTINSASINVPKSGSIDLTFTNPVNASSEPITGTAKFNENYDDWTIAADWADAAATTRTIRKAEGKGDAPVKAIILTSIGGKKSVLETADGYSDDGEANVLIGESAVLPYDLTDDVTFAMTYKLEYQYDGGTPISEDIVIEPTKLTDFAPSIDHWDMNTVYTYHIIIRPNAQIIFDPSVETWAPEAEEPVYVDYQE